MIKARSFLLVILILALGASCMPTPRWPGHVAFFSLASAGDGDAHEIQDDFDYVYQNLVPWLDERGISHSYHRKAPLLIEPRQGEGITLPASLLKDDLGIVLLKGDASRLILYGVHTDVDLALEIKEFLGLEP